MLKSPRRLVLLPLLLLTPSCAATLDYDPGIVAAVDAFCDRYEFCNEFGAGTDFSYADRAACELTVRDVLETIYVETTCERFDETELDNCREQIAATPCTSFTMPLVSVEAFDACEFEVVCD